MGGAVTLRTVRRLHLLALALLACAVVADVYLGLWFAGSAAFTGLAVNAWAAWRLR